MSNTDNSSPVKRGFLDFLVAVVSTSAKKQPEKLSNLLSKTWWLGLGSIAGILMFIQMIQEKPPHSEALNKSTEKSISSYADSTTNANYDNIVQRELTPAHTVPTSSNGLTVGKIDSPSANTFVGPRFNASGSINLRENEKAWLIIRKGILIWPKQEVIIRSGRWERTIHEGGPSGNITLELIVVDVDTSEIEDWFEHGEQLTGDFPGLILTKKARRLDKVTLNLTRQAF